MRATRREAATALIGAGAALIGGAGVAIGGENPRQAILAVIRSMEAAWNRGDFAGYMAGFANPSVVFVSGGRIQSGWQGTLDHYVRDYGASSEQRGTVRFHDMTIDIVGPDAAMLVGHFTLARPCRALEGINTRLFRWIGGRWLITMNHVSSYETN